MMILAGVSISAIVGDDGILSKATDATYRQSCAVLEEYLNMVYANDTIGGIEERRTAKEYLESKYPNWFFKNAQGYVSDAYGHALYLLNMEGIYETNPELRSQLKGGSAKTVADYYAQKDCYGVTSDLKVYYCSRGIDTIMGATLDDLDADNPLEDAYNEESPLAQLVNGDDSGKGLSFQDLKAVTELTITENEKIAVLKETANLPNLKKITFKDLTGVSLNDISKAPKLETINIQNCTITDYTDIGNCSNLVALYLINQPDAEAQTFMTNLKNAKLSKLEYLGMYGTTTNKITDILKLSEWQTETKEAIHYLYLYTEDLASIAALSTFTNLEYLSVYNNANLTSLDGIENLTNLTTIYAYSCALESLPTFVSGSQLEYLSIYSNKNLSSLSGLENCSNLETLYAYNCDLSDITALQNKTNLTYLSLYTNKDLINVAIIATCSNINELYLANNTNMDVDDVRTLATIIANCKHRYSIPDKYVPYLTTLTSYNYGNKNLTDASNEITNLKNGTQIYRLSLSGNTNLGKSRLASLIKGGQMSIDELATIKTNLTLTPEQTAYITSLEGYTLAEIQAMTDAEINAMENESDIYLRYVLSTMPGLQYLSLKNIANIKSIDFMNKVTGIGGLDLYGTGITDLSLLETKGLELRDLRINNKLIDLTTIQNTISRLDGSNAILNSTNANGLSSDGNYFEQVGAGLMIYGNELLNSLSQCTEITSLFMWSHDYTANSVGATPYVFDLSRCTKLKSFTMCRYIKGVLKFPSSLEFARLEDVGRFTIDCTGASSLNTLEMNACTYDEETLESLGRSLGNFDSIQTIQLRCYAHSGDAHKYSDWLKHFKDCTKLETLRVIPYSISTSNNGFFGDMSEIELPSSLKELDLHYMGITKMPDISKCNRLETLIIYMNELKDIDFCKNLSALKSLNAYSNKINSIVGISNCRNLEYINLEDNFIYDNSYITEDGKTKAYNNCSIFADLYSTGLRSLFLKDNYIDDMTPIENLGWEEENKSGF